MRDLLGRLVENLLDNAASFSPQAGAITVSVAASGPQAVVRVADEGPGIPEEHLERVFARFFSYRPGNDAARDHSGLGLAIVRAIVEGYGGTVEASNRPGGGAELVVTLPAAASG